MDSQWRVLVVCSQPESSQRLVGIVSTWKLESIAAGNLSEARKVLQEQAVSLVFCEDTLPDGSYRDLLRMITASGSRTLVVVMLREEQQYAEALQLGAFDVIPFRYRPSDIRWLIFHAIRHVQESRRPSQRKTA